MTIGGQTALVILDRSLWTEVASNPRLAWRVNVGSGSERWTYFIDAQTGQVLHRLTRERTDLDLEVFTGNNNTSGNCWNLGDDPSTLWFTEDGAEAGENIDADGWNAYNSIWSVYNYYRDRHDRRSHDNDDTQIELFVHVDNNWQNSRWIGGFGCDLIEFGDGWPAQDIVGHEFTHGVNDYEHDPPYEDQTGALDESLADTFGEFIEAYADGAADWMVGEDIVGRVNPLRDMTNPPRFSRTCNGVVYPHPDHMDDYRNMACDNGGVHVNSGIPNKAAWMISSVGVRHHNWGDACDADDDNDGIPEDGDGSGRIGDNYCACGDTTQCDDNAPLTPNSDQNDTDCDGVGQVVDNCPDVANPYIGGYPPVQQDNDQDGLGDACDDDDDNDGVLDPDDNCQYHVNPHQIDIDRNGIGLTCDWDEAFMLSADAQQVAMFIQFRDRSPVILPIFPCWGGGCPDETSVFPDGQRAFVSLNMPQAFGARISDDAGSLVTRDHTSRLNKSLSFPVHPSYRFDVASMSPGAMGPSLQVTTSLSDTVRYAQRPLYYLELWPAAETLIGQSYTVQFNLASFAVTSRVYLPVITKNP